jgi:hypothetical protein
LSERLGDALARIARRARICRRVRGCDRRRAGGVGREPGSGSRRSTPWASRLRTTGPAQWSQDFSSAASISCARAGRRCCSEWGRMPRSSPTRSPGVPAEPAGPAGVGSLMVVRGSSTTRLRSTAAKIKHRKSADDHRRVPTDDGIARRWPTSAGRSVAVMDQAAIRSMGSQVHRRIPPAEVAGAYSMPAASPRCHRGYQGSSRRSGHRGHRRGGLRLTPVSLPPTMCA